MPSVLVVGSGASGVHFALSLVKKGYRVTMLDVGNHGTDPVNPEDGLLELKAHLSDPVEYFLGSRYEAVVHPGISKEYYGFPPSKLFIFSPLKDFRLEPHGFAPLLSFSQGGLAEAWTAGAYPLNDHELSDFPFGYRDLEPFYSEVAERIGITGARDDLQRFYPWHNHLQAPLRLDAHSSELLARYEKKKSDIQQTLQCYVGRSRVATLSQDLGRRRACGYLGRCLWGCPIGALYTPSLTLDRCKEYSNFTYLPGFYASHFRFDANGRITAMVGTSIADGSRREFPADRFALAAGTLSSSKILLDSFWNHAKRRVDLTGLMDNRQILIPFVSLGRVGRRYDAESYQYHQVALGIAMERPEEYIHGQLTTLKTGQAHPIVQNVPLGLRGGLSVFKNVRAALGVLNVNLHDRRRRSNSLTLETKGDGNASTLVITYATLPDERARIDHAIQVSKKLLRKLGAVVPPGMLHVRPMGASVHYAGTVPMSSTPNPLTASPNCRSHDFENLYLVDGATFPFLPAKNLTFTLMANAVRVAHNEF